MSNYISIPIVFAISGFYCIPKLVVHKLDNMLFWGLCFAHLALTY